MSSERLYAPVFEPGDLVKRRAVDGTVWVDKIHGDGELFLQSTCQQLQALS